MNLSDILAFGGGVLLLLVAMQLVVLFYTSVRRASAVRMQRRLDSDLFSRRIALASMQLKRQEQAGSWSGTRKFQIEKIVKECDEVASFYLTPHDKKPLPIFLPGQFLTFDLNIPGQRSRVARCYSLSDRPLPDYYRVTIKQVPATAGNKPGLVSNHFHTSLKQGDILDIRAPGGGFYLNVNHLTPVVLLAGGVGITPMVSMLNEITAMSPQREVWLFYCVRNSKDHIFKEHLERVARENPMLHLHNCYSKAGEGDAKGQQYQHEGRVTLELLKSELPSNNFDYFMCGPGAMMQDMHEGLLAWGVPEEKIHMEAFGPASVKRTAAPTSAAPEAGAVAPKVNFSKTGREAAFGKDLDSLLDLALAESIPISYGCRSGNCGTCKTAIKSGKIKYRKNPGCDVETGSCLTCIAIPDGDIALDA